MSEGIRVTVWGENVQERENEAVRTVYPDGMHAVLAAVLREAGYETRTATLDQPQHGLPPEVVQDTDVLVWWGHVAHDRVADEVVARLQAAVLGGMGLVVLHSGHESKVFRALMGTSCSLRWREAEDREVVWTVNPGHSIAEGVPEAFIIPRHEMYGEYFDIPQPDELVFISSFSGGEVFRSGCCFKRGLGRIFYFSPGHETLPVYYQPEVRRVIANAVRWAAPIEQRRLEAPRSQKSPTGWYEPPE
jgi:trehalose utilization protein